MALDPSDDGVAGVDGFVTEALVSVESEPAPPRRRGRVLDAALAARPAGRPPGTAALSPVAAFRRTIGDLDEVLAGLDATGWSAPVEHYDWNVQGLVGHLIAVERLLGARLGAAPVPPAADADHITMSLDVVAAQEGRDPAATLHDWRAATRLAVDALDAAPPDLAERVPFHGVDYRWSSLLVARALEVWTHTDDIRTAAGLPRVVPDAERLALMTDLAVRTLPLRLAATGHSLAGTARIVLTGPGGGAWTQALGRADTPSPSPPATPPDPAAEPVEPRVRLVADAVAFCRLSAGRIGVAELGATVSGDPVLAAAILGSAAAFAV